MNVAEIVELVKKNLKNLIRAKAGSLVVILGPLLIIFLTGLAFDNSNPYAVKIGAFVPEENELTLEFLDHLDERFKVSEYESEEECVDAIKNTDVNTCMVFSEDFTIGLPEKNKITFYVDYSRINLVWTIMQVMTEEVSEKSLQASENLTKVLLETIEYTKERIVSQRGTIITLTTENELISQNTQDLSADLGDIDLSFDTQLAEQNLSNAKTQLKQWAENALSLGSRGLSKAQSFINAADALVKSSGGGQAKQSLLKNFQKSVEDIRELKADMAKSKELSQAAIKRFDAQIAATRKTISETKNKLQEADTSRELSLRVLDAIRGLLDQSLLSLLEVQQSLNDIENRIDAIEIRDPEGITQPIVTAVKPIVQEKTYLNYLFPVLIVLIIMFTALLITPTLILLDKHSPASFRTYMTPVKDISYVIANFITASILLFLQVLIILAIASIFFSEQVIANIPEAMLLLIIINSLFILFGMMLGYIFSSVGHVAYPLQLCLYF